MYQYSENLFVCRFEMLLSLAMRISTLLLILSVGKISCSELTFELPDNAKECFNEKLKVGSKFVLEYQVGKSLNILYCY